MPSPDSDLRRVEKAARAGKPANPAAARPNRSSGSASTRYSRPALAPSLVRPVVVVGAFGATLTFAVGLVVMGGSTATSADRWVQQRIGRWWPNPGSIAYLIDFLGDPRTVAVAAVGLAVICAVLGRRRLAVVALLAPFVTGLVTTLGKLLGQRTIHGENLSYPSGHVGAIATLAAVLALLIVDHLRVGRGARIVIYLSVATGIAFVMAVDQIAIDAHYPLDTVGGLGTAFGAVAMVAVAVDYGTNAVAARRSSRPAEPAPERRNVPPGRRDLRDGRF